MNIEFLPLAINETKFKTITVNEALADIKNQKYKPLIDALPDSIANDAAYRAAKRKLPGWAFHGTFKDSVINANFVESSGLFSFDVDKLNTPEQLIETKKLIVDNCPSLYAIWQSPSGRGLKGLLRILDKFIHGDANFKKAFQQVDAYFSKLGVTIDPTCKDIRRLCFVCSDPDIYINTAAPAYQFDDAIWRASDKPKQHTPHKKPSTNSDKQNQYIARAVNIIEESIPGERHAARLRAGRLAGGQIAGGKVSEAAVVGALMAASDAISAECGDDAATIRTAHKAIFDGIANGKLNPVDDDTKQSNNSKKQEQSKQQTEKPFSLATFSLRGQTEMMRKRMLEQVFVLDGLAILGQLTVFYAQFNTGKTLITLSELIKSISAGRIKGESVFYVNADDTFDGLVTKNSIAEKYGFNMLAPGENDFEPSSFSAYIKQMIEDDSARGVIIVLDTLKKFMDLMDKKGGSNFMKSLRYFVLAGGTVIALAHSNKHKSADGNVVYGGTNDVPSDSDCVFTVDTVSANGTTKQVLFENIKKRGNVVLSKSFSYLEGGDNTYYEIIESVSVDDAVSTFNAKSQKTANDKRQKDILCIEAVLDVLNLGDVCKTDLVGRVHKESGYSKLAVQKVLRDYKGIDWHVIPGDKNTQVFSNKKPIPGSDYLREKYGEI